MLTTEMDGGTFFRMENMSEELEFYRKEKLQSFKNLYGFDMRLLDKWFNDDWFSLDRVNYDLTVWTEQNKEHLSKYEENCHETLVKNYKVDEKQSYCFKMRTKRDE